MQTNNHNIENKRMKIGTGGASRIPTASKMELFVIIANGYPLTIVTNNCILDAGQKEVC